MAALLALVPVIGDILDKFLPDKTQAEAARLEIFKAAQTQQLAELKASADVAAAQSATNSVEASSTRLFVAGWRPFVGWICGFAVGFKFIGGPLLSMVGQALGHPIDLPKIETEELWPLLLGMLGLGGLRTVEKVKGAA